MAGNETQNYDMVIEFTESVFREIFGTLFDSDGLLCDVLGFLDENIPFFPSVPCGAFTVEVLFDAPTDVPGLPDPADTVDVRIELGEDGGIGNLRFVAGVDVNSSDPGLDLIRVNMADKIYFASATLLGITASDGIVKDTLEELDSIPIIPVPVDRATDSPTEIKGANVRIIDDGSSTDRDALGVLLTWGSGEEGNRDGFTRSFLVPSDRGGIVVDFDWLCRILRPRIANALDVPVDAFDPPCRLNRRVRVDDDKKIDLTELELSLVDGAIQVSAAVRKKGRGYTARGRVNGRIEVKIEDGIFKVESEINDPDVDLDVDWWVKLVGAITGGLVGALFGVIGAIVGAVLVPLIIWLATDIIEGLVENIGEKIADAISRLDFEVPAVGLDLLFQEVFIDDIVIQADVTVEDTAPVRASGTITVENGQRVDMDNGIVADETLSGADLVWEGEGRSRQLRTLCDAAIARTNSKTFDGFTRYSLYELSYGSPESIPISELGESLLRSFGLFNITSFTESRQVYGHRTDSERYALFQVVELTDEFIRIRYKTYEKRLPQCSIQGGFRYDYGRLIKPTDNLLTPELTLEATRVFPEEARVPVASDRTIEETVGTETLARGRLSHSSPTLSLSRVPRRPITRSPEVPIPQPEPPEADGPDRPDRPDQVCETVKRGPSRLPKYEVPVRRKVQRGRFVAQLENVRRPVDAQWSIDDEPLDDEGQVVVDGLDVSYQVDDVKLTLTPQDSVDADFDIKVEIEDAEGEKLSCSRCVEFKSEKRTNTRASLNWVAFRNEFVETLSVVERPT